MHYCSETSVAFASIVHITRDINYGFCLKYLHANGASAFFICMYIHVGRGLYYGGYLKKGLWYVGVILVLIMMLTAFIGYVLPWGQMSFWGATVITNFMSAIPWVGTDIVQWVWGGFSVSGVTLNRFFSLHYLFPFVLVGLVLIHIVLLHVTGSSNPIGVTSTADKLSFHPYFTIKDLVGFFLLFFFLAFLVFFAPNDLGDPENFISANPLVTPTHIMPEWYFLFAYAILRAIPNKLGGVLGLVLSILILFLVPHVHTSKSQGSIFRPLAKVFYWAFICNFLLLSWVGAKVVEEPFITIGRFASFFYFFYFLVCIPGLGIIENKILYR